MNHERAQLQGMIVTQVRGHLDETGKQAGTAILVAQIEFFQLVLVFHQGTEALLVPLERLNAQQGIKGQLRQPG